jgi:hypothetical protein
MMNKISAPIKWGIIFSAVSIVIELFVWRLDFMVKVFPAFVGPMLYLSGLSHFPLTVIGWLNSDLVLFFTRWYFPPSIFPNFWGFILIAVFWFGIGVGLGKLYGIYVKKKG